MTKIIYGNSVNPVAKNNASTRRASRRRSEAIQRELVASCIDRALGLKPEKRERLSRAEIHCQRPVKPLLQYPAPANEYTLQIERNAEKYERRNHKLWYKKPKTEYGISCVAKQKVKLGSMPLYC